MEELAELKHARLNCALEVVNDGLMIIGGEVDERVRNDAWFFDLSKRYFDQLENLNQPRNFVFTCVGSTSLFVFSCKDSKTELTYETLDLSFLYNSWVTHRIKFGFIYD